MLLPTINSREEYRVLFKSNQIWEPAIRAICERHQLDLNVVRSEMGSHIVYKSGNLWIKLMAPIFEKEMIYELAGLKSVSGRLTVQIPEIVVQDRIEGWPYIVLTNVPGEPIKTIWPKLNIAQKETVAISMAKTISEIAQCPSDPIVKNRFFWNDFIADQFQNCVLQQQKKSMPEPWLSQTQVFLNQFSIEEFKTQKPVFLHSDLTSDHFLIGETKLSGVIDMADCQFGHPEYELAAPCVFVFKGEQHFLRLFLKEMGYPEQNKRGSEKMLAWCLLHRYFGMASFFKNEMDRCQPGNFSELARMVFPL